MYTSITELITNKETRYRILTFVHINLSIFIAQRYFYKIENYKILIIFYAILSLQLLLHYVHKKYWKDMSMIALSIFLFFAVFLVRYNEATDFSQLKKQKIKHEKTNTNHEHKEKHPFV
jgi:Ca2+/Na+ antiporter